MNSCGSTEDMGDCVSDIDKMRRFNAAMLHPIKHSSRTYFVFKHKKRVKGYRKKVISHKMIAARKDYCKVKK